MRKIFFFAVILLSSHLYAQQHLTSGGKLKPEQAIMDIRHYTIALDVNFEQKSIDGYTTIDVIMAQPTHVLWFDLLDSLEVKQVLVNNKKEPFDHKNDMIHINLWPMNCLPGVLSLKWFMAASRMWPLGRPGTMVLFGRGIQLVIIGWPLPLKALVGNCISRVRTTLPTNRMRASTCSSRCPRIWWLPGQACCKM